MQVSNRIVADVPTAHPGLGFEDYASALAEAILSADRPQFTVGLYGKWGSGKSSLLRAMRRLLGDAPGVIAVDFDAWRYQRTQEIVLPLLYAVLGEVQRSGDQALAGSVWKLVKAFGMSLGFKIPVVGVEVSMTDIKRAWDEEGSPAIALDEAFARPFDELRRVGEALGDRRIVVFVDDLDRCTSDNVVAMLESINVITDVEGFIFVLALDYDVLVQAVHSRYPHASGHEFIEKIIQVPFRIPRIAGGDLAALETLVPSFHSLEHLGGIREELQVAADVVFHGNPRSVKRFVNALTLSMRILPARGVDFDAALLSQLLALELRWPDEFRDVRTAVSAGDADPLLVLRESEDETLRQFAGQIATVSSEDLDPLLRYTSALAETTSTSNQDEADAADRLSRIELGRAQVERALSDLGFALHSRSSNAYYHPEISGYRVVMAKQVVRIEHEAISEFSGRRWELLESYRFTTQAPDAVAAIEKLRRSRKLGR